MPLREDERAEVYEIARKVAAELVEAALKARPVVKAEPAVVAAKEPHHSASKK